MAGKSGVPYLSGTDVLDLQKYRSLRRMKQIVGTDCNFSIIDDIKADYLGHHSRMVEATNKLKEKATWNRPHRSPE